LGYRGWCKIAAMKQKKLTIPKFSSIPEEAKFWDSHDATDYFDQMEDVKARIALKFPLIDLLGIEKSRTGRIGLNIDEIYLSD